MTEADPPNPSPQEGRAEGAVLKHGTRQCTQLLPGTVLGMRDLGGELRADGKTWRSWDTP